MRKLSECLQDLADAVNKDVVVQLAFFSPGEDEGDTIRKTFYPNTTIEV